MSENRPACPGMWVEDPQVTLSRNLGKLIKKWERKTGRSIRSFCRYAGMSKTTFYYVLRGKTWPAPETLRKLASTFGIPVEVLFRR